MNDVKKRILLFCAVTYGVFWVTVFGCYLGGMRYGEGPLVTIGAAMMFLPTVAMLLCRKLTGQELEPEAVGITPHFRGSFPRYAFAYLFPTLLACLSGLLFFASHPGRYDPAATELVDGMVNDVITREIALNGIYSQVTMGIFAGPLVNFITSLAEMLGFQGYLLPQLKALFADGKHSAAKAAVACGFLWGLWYLPFFAGGCFYGAGYPGYPFVGILMGVLFYTLFSVVLSYLTLKTESVFPAALARGGVTAMAAAPLYFTSGAVNLMTGPTAYGLYGCLALLVFALLYMLRIRRMELAGELCYRKPKPRKKKKRG